MKGKGSENRIAWEERMILGDRQPKPVGTFDFDGDAFNPVVHSETQWTTFSLGCFQWVAKTRGKQVKRSKVIKRFRGKVVDADKVVKAARDWCNTEELKLI
jgi:hypothetical protein